VNLDGRRDNVLNGLTRRFGRHEIGLVHHAGQSTPNLTLSLSLRDGRRAGSAGPAQFGAYVNVFFDSKMSGQSVHGWRVFNMKGEKSSPFHHRLNTDGTIDSICLRCFLTAAKADIGSDLQELEAAHRCDKDFWGQSKLPAETHV
jgi:hypothetical protein